MGIVGKKAFSQIREWKYKGRAWAAFLLGIGISVKNCGVYLAYVNQADGMTQIFEPFVVLGSTIPFLMGTTLGGILLLSDAPFLKQISEYEVLREGYKRWFISEILYVILASVLYALVILLGSCLFTACFSRAFIANVWSDSLKRLAYQQPEYVILKYRFVFPFPELLDAVSPMRAVAETFVFQSLYLSLLGICMFVVNLLSEVNIGWIVASLIHIWGYIAYANSGMVISFRLSPLCCASSAYHYVKGYDLSKSYSVFFILVWIIIFISIGAKKFFKTGFNRY